VTIHRPYVNTLSVVVEDAREQLYYWYTAGPRAAQNRNVPVESVHLFSSSRYLWFEHIAPIRQNLINSILFGHRIRYLDHFRLDYELIEFSFAEIRLNPIQFGTSTTTHSDSIPPCHLPRENSHVSVA
jgi:hypothetical protein